MRIGILDDRPDELATTATIIRRNLGDEKWEVVVVPLLESPNLVIEWLSVQGVNVLIADQVLSDTPQTTAIGYTGYDLIVAIRQHIPDLPVYVVTAYGDDDHLDQNQGKFEELIKRGSFSEIAPTVVERMKRAGAAYANRFREQLARLGELSEKRAAAELNPEEEAELTAVQVSLDLADTHSSYIDLLPELEGQTRRLQDLQRQAEAILKKRRRK